MKRFTILIFITFILGATQLNAQGFKAYLALGSNITDDYLTETGNSQVGTRLGLNFGPGVTITIKERWQPSMEMLYSQNGYYSNFGQISTGALDKIKMHYIEVPFTLAYRFNINKKENHHFYKHSIGGGITYARLVNYKIRAVNGMDLTDDIHFDKEHTLLFHVGATSFLNESFALNGRGTLSTFGKWTFAIRLLYYINKK